MWRFLKLHLAVYCLILAVLLLGQSLPAVAQTQAPEPNVQEGLCVGASLDLDTPPGAACAGGTDAIATLNNLIARFINLLSIVVGIVSVIMIIFGGFRYITSAGRDTSVTSAKNTILYAIIGLVIVVLAQVIVRFVLQQSTASV
ncbi:hypothetical protein A3E49_01365 [Candidatus Saccharibacteria bacterium RIFCSPHIGHO2_12_FULL_49_19]|nr:MAG: hypothetical protein A3E49_01365 [Candidatus Saccharibacteria bacterium RIFCSPHIGHO2_12_FULL_49_19]